MKVGLLSLKDLEHVDARTGNEYYIAKGLTEQGVSVKYVPVPPLAWETVILYRLARQYYKRILKRRFATHYEPFFLARQTRMIDRVVEKEGFDCLLATNPRIIAYLTTTVPKIFWTDSSFAGAVNFIPSGMSMSKRHVATCHRIEQKALDVCAFAVYSSSWAAQTAMGRYRVDPSKVKVIPRGANIEVRVGRTMKEIEEIVETRPSDRIRLLFLAGEWYNKRGSLAVEVAEILNNYWGIPTHLDVVGSVPVGLTPRQKEFVTYHGSIDKSRNGGMTKLTSIIARSHFLIMPSFAECVGIQHEEASAFGVPSLGTNVGGTSSVVKSGVTGQLFDRDAPAEQYALYLKSLFPDRDRYERLCRSSFQEYVNRLNWETSIGSVLNLIRAAAVGVTS